MLSSDFISKGDFPRQFQRQIRRTVFFIQLGMGGQAARIPLFAVKVTARVEKLEHVDSTELCQRHQRRALHIHADAPLCLAQCHLPAGFAVEGVRRPHFAFGEVHARFSPRYFGFAGISSDGGA